VQRRRTIILVGLAAALAAGALSARYILRWRERAAVAASGVAAIPDLSRWPAELRQRIEAESSAAAKAGPSPGPLARLADLYSANSLVPQAQQALAALRQLEPENPRWPYLSADLLLRVGDQAGAEQAFRAAVGLDARYAPAWIRLGELQAGLGELDLARDSFGKAVAADPRNVWAQYDFLFHEAQHGGSVEKARLGLADVERDHPDIKEVHGLLADLLEAAHDSAGSARERQLAAASENNMGTADPWVDSLAPLCFDTNRLMIRAIEMRREARFGEAEMLLKRAVELAEREPANPLPWDLLSNFYVKMNRPAEARATLEKAVAEFPDDPPMYVLLARMLSAQHEPAAAIAAIQAAVRRWPARGDLRATLGLALCDAGDYAGAEAPLREALRLDSTQTEARYLLGSCLLELGRRDAARQELGKALAIRPEYPEALYAMARAGLESGDLAGSQPYVDKLYALGPDDPNARYLLATWHLAKGKEAAQSGDLDEAARQYGAGLALSPEHGALLREKGALDAQAGRLAQATQALEHYLRVEPADPQGYLLLGLTLQRAGRPADSSAVFQRGLDAARKANDSEAAERFKGLLGGPGAP